MLKSKSEIVTYHRGLVISGGLVSLVDGRKEVCQLKFHKLHNSSLIYRIGNAVMLLCVST